jgi:hypothetical protein
MQQRLSPLIVDACVAINIRATGRWEEIFTAACWQPVMTTIALREVLYLFDDDGERQQAALDVDEVEGCLWSRELDERQLKLMLSLVSTLGPGEASSLALAATENLPIATDDQAASRHDVAQPIRVVATTELIRQWANFGVSDEIVREAIGVIDSRARFRPGAADPNHPWWISRIS